MEGAKKPSTAMTKEKTRMVVTDPQCNACATHAFCSIRKIKDAREKEKDPSTRTNIDKVFTYYYTPKATAGAPLPFRPIRGTIVHKNSSLRPANFCYTTPGKRVIARVTHGETTSTLAHANVQRYQSNTFLATSQSSFVWCPNFCLVRFILSAPACLVNSSAQWAWWFIHV